MSRNVLKYSLFIAAVCALFFVWIGEFPLWSSDEGRYAEIAREMWESKDFIVPHFNYFDYLEKPVLAPLLTSLAYGLFGINAFSARLVPVLASLLGILMTFLFTQRLFDRRTAGYAALVLATTIGYVLVGRFAVIDMLMTLFLSGSLFCLMTAYTLRRPACYLTAYGFMGLAFLTKGLIAFILPGLVFLSFLVWMKDFGEIKRMRLGYGLLITGAIILPWMIAVSIREPEFFDVFIIQNHFSRFFHGSFGRAKPFWFYVPVLLAVAFPWIFFMPAALAHEFKKGEQTKIKVRFLICWMVAIFVFFSIPKSKLPYYLLPISVPIAVLISLFLADGIHAGALSERTKRILKWTWNLLLGAAGAGAVGLNLYLSWGNLDSETLLLRPLFQIGSVFLFAGFGTGFFLSRKGHFKRSIFVLSATVYVGLLLAFLGMKMISPLQSSYDYAELIKTHLKKDDIVAVMASPDEFSDLPFYLERRVMVVGTDKGTLTYESEESDHGLETAEWFVSKGELAAMFREKRKRIFCLMESHKLQEFINAGIQGFVVLKEGHGKLLVSNQPL